ncbi:MAG: DUF4169 family protein [Hyphococcus sp.]
MSNVVNLNRFRKKKKRAKKEQRAIENRATFGRTKAEKTLEKHEKESAKHHLDGCNIKDDDE